MDVKDLRATTDPRSIKGFLKGVVLGMENSKKIKGYTAKISWAMYFFQVSDWMLMQAP